MLQNVDTAKLHQLADYLDGGTISSKDFFMGAWVLRPARPARTRFFGLIETRPACGFAGCAMGWAAHSGIFEGLTLDPLGSVDYQGRHGYEAAMKLFGITPQIAEFFFSPHRYRFKYLGGTAAPKEVATRIRRYATKVDAIRARANRPAAVIVKERIPEPA